MPLYWFTYSFFKNTSVNTASLHLLYLHDWTRWEKKNWFPHHPHRSGNLYLASWSGQNIWIHFWLLPFFHIPHSVHQQILLILRAKPFNFFLPPVLVLLQSKPSSVPLWINRFPASYIAILWYFFNILSPNILPLT